MTKRFTPQLTAVALALALTAATGTANAATPGYVSSASDPIVTSPYGLCWKTSSWTPADAVAPCDAVQTVSAPPPPPVVVVPAPAPIAVAPAAPPAPVIEKLSLASDVLFEFDKAQLRPQGRDELDKLADRIKDAQIQQVLTVGYADPIGNEQYNQKLSQARAEAVKQHLAQKGIEDQRMTIEGRGETQQFTAGECKGMKGAKLISCLQPNRRVEIEVRGTREVASTGSPAAGGTSGSSSGGATGTAK